jgi:hypothetical protein
MATAESVLYPLWNVPPELQSDRYNSEELQDEKFVAEQILGLWETRKQYEELMEVDGKGFRSVNRTLGQLLYLMKSLLARPGRNGQWSSWLAQRKISRATADRLVNRFAKSINVKLPHEAITEQEPTELEIGKLFFAIWRRCENKLSTPRSRYNFLSILISHSGLDHECRGNGVFLFDPAHIAAPEQPQTIFSPQETVSGFEHGDDLYGDVL